MHPLKRTSDSPCAPNFRGNVCHADSIFSFHHVQGMFSRLPTIGETEKTALTIKTAIEKSWLTYYFTLANPWTSNFTAAMESAESYLQQEPDEPYNLMCVALVYGFKSRTAKRLRPWHNRRRDFRRDCPTPLIDVPQAGKL